MHSSMQICNGKHRMGSPNKDGRKQVARWAIERYPLTIICCYQCGSSLPAETPPVFLGSGRMVAHWEVTRSAIRRHWGGAKIE
jgi:hypothetical protein